MRHLEKRANVWYAKLTIPAEVRSTIGKLRFFQSTKTGELAKAHERAAVLVIGWKAEIAKARGLVPETRDTFWHDIRKEFAAATIADREVMGDEESGGTLASEIAEVIQAAAMKLGDVERASFMYRTATMQLPALPPLPEPAKATPLASLVTDWKDSLRLKAKTSDQMHRDVLKMAAEFVNLEALQPQDIKTWMDKLMKEEKATASTVDRYGKSYRSFWKYLRRAGPVTMLTPDPFEGPMELALSMAPRTKTGRSGSSYTPKQMVELYTAAVDKGDTVLADVIALGAYTGARIEEVCQLTKETAQGTVFRWGTKTKASKRETPIHPALVTLVARLTKASTDGFLVPSSADNQYGVRSDPISKRFGHLKKAMGYGRSHVFHTTRGTLIDRENRSHLDTMKCRPKAQTWMPRLPQPPGPLIGSVSIFQYVPGPRSQPTIQRSRPRRRQNHCFTATVEKR